MVGLVGTHRLLCAERTVDWLCSILTARNASHCIRNITRRLGYRPGRGFHVNKQLLKVGPTHNAELYYLSIIKKIEIRSDF